MLEEKITQEQIDSLYWKLPLALRQKINPEPVLTPVQKAFKAANFARLNASICPSYYRTAEKAGAHHAREAALAVARAGGALPPLTNRGGKSEQSEAPKIASLEALEDLQIVAVGYKGKAQFIRIPKPDRCVSQRHAFVDWVNFTFKVGIHPINLSSGHPAITDRDYVQALSGELYSVFGFGVSRQRESGMNFYKESYELGENGWGLVCIGGQRDSVSVTVKGQGLMAAKSGWEQRLYNYLRLIPDARLTRLDLASDSFDSDTSLDDYLAMYNAGMFVNRGRAPNVEQAGNWINPNGKGRTLYIGGRSSGKLLRIYEKGLQLANGFHEKFPRWVRVELELKNDDRIIPLDALLKPGQYLAGAYPALKLFHPVQERIETYKKVIETTVERAVETTRHQFGRYIWALSEIFGIEETFKKLTVDKESLPKAFANVAEFQAVRPASEYIHTNTIHTIGDIGSWQNSTF